MRRVLLLLGAATLALSACKAAQSPAASDDRVEHATIAADAVAKPPAPPSASGSPANTALQANPPPSSAATPLLAYSYDYGVDAPPANIRALVTKAQATCTAAGIAACEITGVNVSEAGPDQVTAHLTLKATPAWLTGYEGRLASDAQGAGGKLTKTEVTTEDLSRQIVDTQAAVAAQTALRDRLLQMLQTRQGSLADLLAVQEKLAEVQGNLDATNSELAAMKERIATSDVTIDYASTGVLAPQGTWSPIGEAMTGASGVLAASVAVLIYAVAFLSPWVLIIGGLLWAFRKRLFRPRQPRPAPAPPTPPAP
jgi:hypothetical protein